MQNEFEAIFEKHFEDIGMSLREEVDILFDYIDFISTCPIDEFEPLECWLEKYHPVSLHQLSLHKILLS